MLLVEDEEHSRLALQRLLQSRGFQVTAVESAEEALYLLEHANGSPPCYMVVDVDLPGINGMELICKALVGRPKLHAMLVTAADQTLVKNFATEHDVDYFPKPLDVNRFFAHLRMASSHHRHRPMTNSA